MSKKIGHFLFIMLVLWSVLLLMATGSRTEAKQEPVQTDSVQHSAPKETTPQPSVPDATLQTTDPEKTAFWRVKKVLDARKLDETARSYWVWNPDLNPQAEAQGTAAASQGWALAQLAAERKMNPIAAFWELVAEGLYQKTEDTSDAMTAEPFSVPEQAAKTYAYTGEGARLLVTDLLTLASGMEDGLALEPGLLGPDGAVSLEQVSLAWEESCYYGYFISGGERSTHILCFYLRGDKNGEWITDVEFQLLNLRSAQGSAAALAQLDRRGDTQAAAFIAAAELLMTGQTQAGEGEIPFTRQVASFTATIERFHFTAEGEAGTLTNYRLKK